jgi:hypothetical protein
MVRAKLGVSHPDYKNDNTYDTGGDDDLLHLVVFPIGGRSPSSVFQNVHGLSYQLLPATTHNN